jgi:ApaG protein
MVSMISEGIKINVETFYQQDYSQPLDHQFMFAYRITIENFNSFPVKLLSRKWIIFDSDNDGYREVEGEGVVGMTPILKPMEEYQYVSGCNLHSEMGQMHGYYIMENQQTKEKFKARIPKFDLITPFKMN